MAVLQRHKNTIYGLNSDLLALQNADASEATTRASEITRVEGLVSAEESSRIAADGDLTTLSTTEKGSLVGAINEVVSSVSSQSTSLNDAIDSEEAARIAADEALDARLDIVEGDDTVVGSIAKAESDAKAYADSILSAFEAGDFQTLEDLVAVINSDSTVDGSFRKAIADVVGAAPEALDTLQEIAASLANDPDLDGTLRTLVSTNITAAKEEIKGEVSEAFDTLAEVETKLGELDSTIATNATNASTALTDAIAQEVIDRDAAILVETNARIAAVTAENTRAVAAEEANADAIAALDADTYSIAETDEAIRLGGAIFVSEIITVSSDKIVLANAPKNGVVFNFATVRHTDANFVSYDIPVTVTATAGGKEFQLHPNTTGEFDDKSVMIQYAYVPVA